jgi:hypothetical protein
MNSPFAIHSSLVWAGLLAGGLLLAAPGVQAQPAGAPVAGTPNNETARAPDDETAREQATEDARRDVRHWQARMHSFGVRAHAETDQLNAQAQDELYSAWGEVKLDWQHLQASDEGNWPKARALFDRGVARLKSAWSHATKQS